MEKRKKKKKKKQIAVAAKLVARSGITSHEGAGTGMRLCSFKARLAF